MSLKKYILEPLFNYWSIERKLKENDQRGNYATIIFKTGFKINDNFYITRHSLGEEILSKGIQCRENN